MDSIIRQLTGHCARKRCLLVLDNVEDDTSARLMPGGRTSVLITTRFMNLRFLRGYQPLSLPLFTEEQYLNSFAKSLAKKKWEDTRPRDVRSSGDWDTCPSVTFQDLADKLKMDVQVPLG